MSAEQRVARRVSAAVIVVLGLAGLVAKQPVFGDLVAEEV
jgi:hypothetical protein